MPYSYLSNFLKTAFFLFLTGIVSSVFAQSGTVSVIGTIIDAGTKKPIEFASVGLQDLTGKTVGGVACDIEGKFVIPNITQGRYVLAVSFVGYQNKSQPINVGSSSSTFNAGNISLDLSSQSLKEVTVTAVKPIIEETDDGLVYNAENDLSAVGGTAADVLKNVPMLSVDLDGNVSLQGTNKIKVLINNKPSTIMANDVAEALRQIPADMIKRIEVITAPSAKYESEGTGGIINIVTKKNTLEGVNGNLNASAGNRTKNSNVNVNIRKKKVGIRASTGVNFNNNFGSSESDQSIFETKQVAQSSSYDRQGRSTYAQIGGDYEFDEKTELSLNIRANKGDNENDRLQNSVETDLNGKVIRQFKRTTESIDNFDNIDANVDFRKEFKEDQTLSIEGSYSKNKRLNKYDLVQQDAESVINYLEQNNNNSGNSELNLEADYEQQITPKSEIEAGLRTSLRSAESDYRFSSALSPDALFMPNADRSNMFNNQQNVFSSYLSYTYSFTKNIRLEVGGRYEYTDVQANFVSKNTSVDRPYQNILPNVSFRMRVKENQRFRISYSPRIQRPDINLLNPYRDTRNQYSVRFGNPDLDPERTHQVSMEYSTYFKNNTYLSFSSFYRTIGNDIGQFQYQSPAKDTIYITYLNLGKKNTVGGSFSGSGRFHERGQIGGNLNVYYTKINNTGTDLTNSGVMYNLNVNASYRFEKNISAQVNGSFNSPNIELQGRSSSFQSYSVGLRREFWDKKAGISINAENFLNGGNRIRSTFETNQFKTSSVNNFNNRIYRLSFNYRFGKIKFKSDEKK